MTQQKTNEIKVTTFRPFLYTYQLDMNGQASRTNRNLLTFMLFQICGLGYSQEMNYIILTIISYNKCMYIQSFDRT